MDKTPNYDLPILTSNEDPKVLDVFDAVMGDNNSSAMNKIDNAINSVQDDIDTHISDTGEAFNTVNSQISGLQTSISDLQAHVGYNDDEILGVEVDYENKTFQRLSAAIGKTEGADFNSYSMYGQRRRCNLTDSGEVLAYYGDEEYSETGFLTKPVLKNGVLYPVGTTVQVMVEQPSFYYKVVPLKTDDTGKVHVCEIEITSSSTSDNGVNVTLDGTLYMVPVLQPVSSPENIASNFAYAGIEGWTLSIEGAIVTLTSSTVGEHTVVVDGSSAGVTTTVTTKQKGYGTRGLILRKARYFISKNKKDEFKIHPAFIKNNVRVDKIYLSAYEGCLYNSSEGYILDDNQLYTDFDTNLLSSIAGAKPLSGEDMNLTRRNCGKLAENRGVGWSQAYLNTISCSQLLFLIEYASLNSQTAIGKGVVDEISNALNTSKTTGATSTLGNISGMATGTNGLVSVTYRGEENLWGNIDKFIDGVNILCDPSNNIHEAYIADHSFTESKFSDNYANVEIRLSLKNGYISAFGYDSNYDWLFLPTETDGNSALPVGDNFYQDSGNSNDKIALFGGNWNDSTSAGAFLYAMSVIPSYHSYDTGGRLVYVPVVQ